VNGLIELTDCSITGRSSLGLTETVDAEGTALAAGVDASSEECNEALSGFAIRSPPRDWERLISPSILSASDPGTR
jgi:hypothetical protein